MRELKFFLVILFAIFIPVFLIEAQDLPKIIISEIYYNPDSLHGATGTSEWKNEWIEIKNLDQKEIDISGWRISDNNATISIPQSSPIPSNGFAIITSDISTFSFWQIPENTIKIVLGQKIGNGLSNTEDFLVLRDSQGNVIDLVSWGKNPQNETICKIPNKDGISLEKKPFYFEQNTLFCSYFNQENPNPGKEVLDFYWKEKIEDSKDSISGYEILSAQVVTGEDEILEFLPPLMPGPLCKTLIAKLDFEEILSQDYYFEFEEKEGYGGAAMLIETENKIFLFAFDLSSDLPYLFVAENGGETWYSTTSEYFIYQFGNSLIFALNMEKLSPLPWKVKFFIWVFV